MCAGDALQNTEVLASKGAEGPVGGFCSLAKMQNLDLGVLFFFLNEYVPDAAAVFALGREPVLSGGTQKVPACSRHVAALLTQGSPFR